MSGVGGWLGHHVRPVAGYFGAPFLTRVCHSTSAATMVPSSLPMRSAVKASEPVWRRSKSSRSLCGRTFLRNRFSSRLRDELLNVEEFMTLAETRWFARHRREEHDVERPCNSLGYMTPAAFASQCAPYLRATPSLQGHTVEAFIQPELS